MPSRLSLPTTKAHPMRANGRVHCDYWCAYQRLVQTAPIAQRLCSTPTRKELPRNRPIDTFQDVGHGVALMCRKADDSYRIITAVGADVWQPTERWVFCCLTAIPPRPFVQFRCEHARSTRKESDGARVDAGKISNATAFPNPALQSSGRRPNFFVSRLVSGFVN